MALKSVLLVLCLTLTVVSVPFGTSDPQPVAAVAPPATTAHVPGADTWRAAAESGTAVPVSWRGDILAIVVQPNEHVDPARFPVQDAAGAAIATAHIATLAGEVLGHPGSTVRITLADDRVDGMILGVDGSHLGFTTENGVTRLATPAEATAEAPTVLRRIDDETMPGTEVGGEGCGAPFYIMGSPTGLVGGWPERIIDIAIAVDDAYANGINGGDWLAATVALANRLDGFYDHENDMRFSPVHIIRVPQSIFSESTTSAYLGSIATYYDANHAALYRELVYLMSGTDFTNALGQASCIGGAGDGRSHYATGWMLFEQEVSGFIGPFQVYGDGALKTIAHEVGHQLGVRHEQHNCVELVDALSPTRPLDVCTTMAPFVDLHGVGFSTWSRLTSRGLADQRQL